MVHNIGVIYLYRFAEGEYPVRRFIHSYREHSAGVAHDFHVIFKGFPDRPSLRLAQSLFADIPINAIELADIGYDIGSYVQAAKAVGNKRLIFFNTFSQILARRLAGPFRSRFEFARNWARRCQRILARKYVKL